MGFVVVRIEGWGDRSAVRDGAATCACFQLTYQRTSLSGNAVSETIFGGMMESVIFAGIFSLLAAILGALITVINQNLQQKKQNDTLRREQAAMQKKAVIEDLVAYRFVLTDKSNHAIPTTQFNVALSKIPVLFGSNARCIELYREFGVNFTASKFHDLIIELMRDVPLDTRHINAALLENVPSRRPMLGT